MNVVPRFDTIFSGKPCSVKTLAINASANLSAVQVSFAGVKWDVLKMIYNYHHRVKTL